MSHLISSVELLIFNHPSTPEIYTLSLHDALPISPRGWRPPPVRSGRGWPPPWGWPSPSAGCAVCSTRTPPRAPDRKSTRLNSSHVAISYAVFCLKKKNTIHSGQFYTKRGGEINTA